jgi:hypothetical protein
MAWDHRLHMIGRDFWKRHFLDPPTRGQRLFDGVAGVWLPLFCLYLDPVVFTHQSIGDSSDAQGLLASSRAFAYLLVGLQTALLTVWILCPRRLSGPAGLLAGAFFVGALFSVWVGYRIFFISLVGLAFALLGSLGFTPLFTAFIYTRNGVRALLAVRSSWGWPPAAVSALLGAGLAFAFPLHFEQRMEEWLDDQEGRGVATLFERAPLPAPVAFVREGGRPLVAVGGKDGMVRFWDAGATAFERKIPAHAGWIRCLSAPFEGTELAVAGIEGVILVDARSGAVLRELAGPEEPMRALSFSGDGAFLAAAGRGGRLVIWDPRTGDRLRSRTGLERDITALAFFPDGSLLACAHGTLDRAGFHGTVEIRDPWSWALLVEVEPFSHGFPTALSFSHDGRFLASGEWMGLPTQEGGWESFGEVLICDWDSPERTLYSRFECPGTTHHRVRGLSVAFSPDGQTLAVGAGAGRACLWAGEKELDCLWLPVAADR